MINRPAGSTSTGSEREKEGGKRKSGGPYDQVLIGYNLRSLAFLSPQRASRRQPVGLSPAGFRQ